MPFLSGGFKVGGQDQLKKKIYSHCQKSVLDVFSSVMTPKAAVIAAYQTDVDSFYICPFVSTSFGLTAAKVLCNHQPINLHVWSPVRRHQYSTWWLRSSGLTSLILILKLNTIRKWEEHVCGFLGPLLKPQPEYWSAVDFKVHFQELPLRASFSALFGLSQAAKGSSNSLLDSDRRCQRRPDSLAIFHLPGSHPASLLASNAQEEGAGKVGWGDHLEKLVCLM